MREIIIGQFVRRTKPQEPFKEGAPKRIGLLFEVLESSGDGSPSKAERWVNCTIRDEAWYSPFQSGDQVPLIKEWDGKKKDYRYRAVDASTISTPEPATPERTLLDTCRDAFKLWQFLGRPVAGGASSSPIEMVLAQLTGDEIITPDQAAWSQSRFAELGDLLARLGASLKHLTQ